MQCYYASLFTKSHNMLNSFSLLISWFSEQPVSSFWTSLKQLKEQAVFLEPNLINGAPEWKHILKVTPA